jgi:hypothetical protein
MKCCSVEPQPATSTKAIQAGVDFLVVADVVLPEMHRISRSHCLELADAGPPLRGVLSLKEDLRI